MTQCSLLRDLIVIYKHCNNLRYDNEVAELLAIDRVSLSHYLNGRRRMPDRLLAIIADSINVSFGDVVCAANSALSNLNKDDRAEWLNRIAHIGLSGQASSVEEKI